MSERLAKAADFSEQLRAARTGTRGAHGKEMSESETGWRPELVAERLAEAADVLTRLPEERVRGLYDLWPRIVGAPCGASGPAAAAPEAIDRMEDALGWAVLDRRR